MIKLKLSRTELQLLIYAIYVATQHTKADTPENVTKLKKLVELEKRLTDIYYNEVKRR